MSWNISPNATQRVVNTLKGGASNWLAKADENVVAKHVADNSR